MAESSAAICLDERGSVFGAGPITVDPGAQNQGLGRRLMQAVLDRSRERETPSVSPAPIGVSQPVFIALHQLGFDPREPMSVMQGPPLQSRIDGGAVRAARMRDLEAANWGCERVYGHSRSGELRDAIGQGTARVVERHGRITGSVSAFGYFGHAVGEANLDLQALIAATDSFGGPGTLVPTRNAEPFPPVFGEQTSRSNRVR